jgi:hypothetical protein
VRAAWVDPLVLWKRVYRVRQYRDKAAELQARLFIEQKMRQHNKVTICGCKDDFSCRRQYAAFVNVTNVTVNLINNDCVRVVDRWT